MHAYLSDDWAAEVAALLATQSSGVARGSTPFIVEYELDNAPDGCAPRHSQMFVDRQLVDWKLGSSGRPDVTVRRTYEFDRDDLLSRADADRVAEASTLQTAEVGRVDVFGVGTDISAEAAPPPGFQFGLGLCSPDTAFGPVERRYVVDADGLHAGPVEAPDVVVRGPYVHLMAWLHQEDRLLGHFLVCDDFGTTVDGDYFKMSAIEGVVSAPKATPTIERAGHLLSYAARRRHTHVRALVDAVDSFTL